MPCWTDTDDRKLLLAVIALTHVAPEWEDVGAQMGRTGESVRYASTRRAPCHTLTYVCSQRFAKLKKEAGDASTATAVVPATPRKRKPAKAKAKKTAVVEDDGEDDEEPTPLPKKAKKVKAEVDDEEV
jgi:hypothetical protein